MTTVKAAWIEARDQLTAVSESATLDAQVLLTDIMGAHDRAWLFAHPEAELTTEQAARYTEMIERRERGEPMAYIRGFKPWYDRNIIVTPDVLIPRPETELLVQHALAAARGRRVRVADVCTGSGAIAVTLAAHLPNASVVGTDISPAALTVARQNSDAAGVQIDWREGDLLAPVSGERFDVIVSNPPYIARDVLATLDVRHHEPSLALDGGADGLDFVRRLLVGAWDVMRPDGVLLMEIGADQGEAALALAEELLSPLEARIVQDEAGRDRILYARIGMG